jgi:hypothetical protein
VESQYGDDGEIELRQVFEMEDFGPSQSMEREAELRAEIAKKK